MKVFVLLAWYDEPVESLKRAVASCAGLADHLIATDGRYRLFPGKTISRQSEANVIRRACYEHGIGLTLTIPTEPWESETAKRTAHFRLAEALGTPYEDWLIALDGDEELHYQQEFKGHLEGSPHDVLAVRCEQAEKEMNETEDALTTLGTDRAAVYYRGFCLRLQRDMRVEWPTHWQFSGMNRDGNRVRLDDSTPAEGLKIVHYNLQRTMERKQAKAEYIAARNASGES